MRRGRLLASLFGLAIVLALGALRLADPYPVQALRDISFDFYQRLKPREVPEGLPIRVVDIDEASLAAIGQWPWPRSTIALLNQRLGELGAAAIAFDVLFPEADRTDAGGDAAFAATLAQTPSVLGFSVSGATTTLPDHAKSGFAISGTDPTAAIPRMNGTVLPLPALRDAAPGLGSVSLNATDLVAIIRRLPLLWSTADGQLYPSLAVEALRLAMGASTLVVLGETDAGFVEALRIGQFVVPTMPAGDLWLYHRSPDPALFVSAADILGDDYAATVDRIAGHIVLIGTSASGLFDIHGTPLGENVAGVSLHAQALEQILTETYLIRTDWVSGLEIVGFALVGLFLVLVVLRLGPRAGLLAGAGMVAAIVGTAWYMFAERGILVDPSFPMIGATLVYGAMVFFQFAIADADKRQIRRAFGHYVSPELLTEIERTGSLKLGGELREITVMFADVRGFTPMSEALPPERMVAVLNTLFEALGHEILAQYGTIDKFIGDALMAFWNAPVDVPDHPARACAAALGMRSSLRRLNETDGFGLKGTTSGPTTLAIGIGIDTGEALVGNMGLERRFDYSCIGDTVNTASRLEGGNKPLGYDILVTEEVREAALGFAMLHGGDLPLKGKGAPVPAYLLVGGPELSGTVAFSQLAGAHAAAVELLRADAPAGPAIARCLELCDAVEPGLRRFYELLPGRSADFTAARPAPPDDPVLHTLAASG